MIHKERIGSNRSGKYPWFEVDIDELLMECSFREAIGVSVDKREKLKKDKKPLKLKLTKSTEVHVLAVTLDGGYEFVPASEQRPAYYAHVAWYNPVTQEWKVLDFQEDAPPPAMRPAPYDRSRNEYTITDRKVQVRVSAGGGPKEEGKRE